MPVSSFRPAKPSATVLADLGLLAELAGDWKGHGFNLIVRPNFAGGQNLYLQLNQTDDHIQVTPIGSAIPNRGFLQGDIELFGLTYLQQISDRSNGGALHIEPGIWVTTKDPITEPPVVVPAGSQVIARMASIPHGNALLAQGTATLFAGPPTLAGGPTPYAGSQFLSFNSTPVPAIPPPLVISAAGSSEKQTAIAAGVAPGFEEYDLLVADSAVNPRTPFGTSPPEPALPPDINGVPMQQVVNDPILLLQADIDAQVSDGYQFEGVVLNIASQAAVSFRDLPNQPAGPSTVVNVTDAAGGIENILFLEGGEPVAPHGPNVDTALVYATFWIEKVSHPDRPSFMQLQYAQMVILNFAILSALPAVVLLGWPHITVATLKKRFG